MFLDINLSDINPIIPTSILGLIGIAFFYLYGSYKTKKDNELKEIQSIQSDEKKTEVIEMRLNEFGTRIPTDGLSPEQKFTLLKKLIREKTLRYLITAITSIIFAAIIGFILSGSPKQNGKPATLTYLEAVLSLDSLNHSIYLELKADRIDTTKDTYQNLQLIRLGDQSKRASYVSSVKTLRENNATIKQYLLDAMSEIKTPTFKEKANQFIQHAGMVDTRYESAMQSDTTSNLPKITIGYPDDFRNALKEEIKTWKD